MWPTKSLSVLAYFAQYVVSLTTVTYRKTSSSATAEIARVGGRLRRSRSFKVTDVSTSQKPACNFLLVNNVILTCIPISRTVFQLPRSSGLIILFYKGMPLISAFVLGNLCEYRHIAISYILLKTSLLGYIFVSHSMSLSSNINLMYWPQSYRIR